MFFSFFFSSVFLSSFFFQKLTSCEMELVWAISRCWHDWTAGMSFYGSFRFRGLKRAAASGTAV